jgi:hypothetical protein
MTAYPLTAKMRQNNIKPMMIFRFIVSVAHLLSIQAPNQATASRFPRPKATAFGNSIEKRAIRVKRIKTVRRPCASGSSTSLRPGDHPFPMVNRWSSPTEQPLQVFHPNVSNSFFLRMHIFIGTIS